MTLAVMRPLEPRLSLQRLKGRVDPRGHDVIDKAVA